ncbi:putative lipid II flippase FtsW [Luteolibacter flavescens]|uniref:Probable peptidoglycan glycosyltransferase FtsW n=1 Tax=Luteolibacter flavescens TaxID=1859460 RepID=A0ABT3FMQ0_9BACT|nr:putative peptidoglycan glycosyltransferase FtsW [Luteolibacter flavescens]MCW1884838.1 putative lipid II flippase FtsW [Luteolibacter flavescens]
MNRSASILLCTAVAALVSLGLVMLTSTGAWVKSAATPYAFVIDQSKYAVVGLIAAFIAAKLDPIWLRRAWPWALAFACVLLVLCFVPGVGVEYLGANRWIRVPGIGTFQPSELAKVIALIAMAGWFARWQTEVHTFWRGFVLPGMLVGLPVALIAIETDVGSALALSVAAGALFFCVGTRLLFIIPTAVTGITGAIWYIMSDPVRSSRIEAWLDLETYQRGKGQQQWRALLAFGNGGPEGVGLGNGSEKFGTLTFAYSDFIFPVVGEELGLPFTLGTVLCYVIIAVCGCSIAIRASNLFDRCLALGMTCALVIPAMVNIAVTTAALPNDGLPLPFVSHGGTSLMICLGVVGLLCGIHRRSYVTHDSGEPVLGNKVYAVKL